MKIILPLILGIGLIISLIFIKIQKDERNEMLNSLQLIDIKYE